jgi:DNA-binding LacI/PurR family transcriptional regulator
VSSAARPASPTLEQVAALAGVSRSTVSRVVNDSPRVSDPARRAVAEAIEALGYVPNRVARSLATRRTGSIALVVREPETRVFEEPFFAAIVRGISTAIAETDLQLALLMAGPGRGDERLERFLAGGHADGVLLLSLHGADPLPLRLVERGMPTVLGGRPPEPHPGLAWVDVDNVGGARSATDHLLGRGRRRIGVVTGPLDTVAARDRLDGHRTALAAAGIAADTTLEEPGGFSRDEGRDAARRLLDRRPDLDAVVAGSDLAAAGVLEALRERGRRVPEDVAVTGFDDASTATSTDPPLTTVRQDVAHLGAEMVRVLLGTLAGGEATPAARLVLPTELVVRGSTGAGGG